jgi:electron transport complex protein RnfB
MADLENLLNLLPQTQCRQCGFEGCEPYAKAMLKGESDINRCPPGGQEGVVRLATFFAKEVKPLNPECGQESTRVVAVIREDACIGCTLCIQACPVDAIVGAAKQMHTVDTDRCTGCRLCAPPCPMDCIDWVTVSGDKTGWRAWSEVQAKEARFNFEQRRSRLTKKKQDTRFEPEQKDVSPAEVNEINLKQQMIQKALQRASLQKTN